MTKLQLITVGGALILFMGLYLGIRTKPLAQEKIEKMRSSVAESTSINSLLLEAKPTLDAQQTSFIVALDKQLEAAPNDSTRINTLKELSGKWFDYNRADIAGFYAEQVAELEKTEESWSITGTTFLIGSRKTKVEKVKQFCVDRAIKAFEGASSLNPDNIQHKVNLATCYAENPPKDNPMKGILLLLDLNKKNPESVPVLVSLARFGLQTGQYDKAIERLSKAIALAPNHKQATCMLAQAYQLAGNTKESRLFEEKCAALVGQ